MERWGINNYEEMLGSVMMTERRKDCRDCMQIVLIEEKLKNILDLMNRMEGRLIEVENGVDEFSEKLSEIEKKWVMLNSRVEVVMGKIEDLNKDSKRILEGFDERLKGLEEERENMIVMMDFLEKVKKVFDNVFMKVGMVVVIICGFVGFGLLFFMLAREVLKFL